MTAEQVQRYIQLASRKEYILAKSGVAWLPEYEGELQQINKELALLRPLVDAEHNRRKEHERCLHLQM